MDILDGKGKKIQNTSYHSRNITFWPVISVTRFRYIMTLFWMISTTLLKNVWIGLVSNYLDIVSAGQEKFIEIPDSDMTETLTVTRTVTTIEREEQIVTQMVKPQITTPLEPEIFVRERGIAR